MQVSSTPIEVLVLSSNNFTASGIGALADALATGNTKLEELRLINCGLQDDSIQLLAPALSKAPLQILE